MLNKNEKVVILENDDIAISLTEYQKCLCLKFHAFLSFLENNGIKYSLAFGTLLGAVREGGIIKWDFDIDIFVNDSDVKLIKELIAKSNRKDWLFKTFTNNECGYGESRIYFNDLKVYRPFFKEKQVEYAHIDIYHYRNVSFLEHLNKNVIKRYKRLLLLNNIKNDKDFSSNIIKKYLKKALLPFLPSSRTINKKFDSLHRKYDKNNKNVLTILDPSESFKETPSFVDQYEYMSFNGRKCFVFANYDELLKCFYGNNYMTPYNDGRSEGVFYYITYKNN